LELALGDGIYRVRGPQLPFAVDLRVSPQGVIGRWDLSLHRPPVRETIPVLKPGSQVITLVNDTPRDLLVRLERTAGRQLAFTAADASSLALFREMFPDEVLAPGQIVSVTTVTLFLAQIHQAAALYERLGDGPAFGQLRRELARMNEAIEKNGGAVVKTVGEGVVATFAEPIAAIRTGLELLSKQTDDSLRLQMAVHRGPAMVTTLNDRLDYFGGTANRVRELLAIAGPSELLLTETVAAQPEITQLMREHQVDADLLSSGNGSLQSIIHRWRIPPR
jgi:class 3 adenylate cyclase